jgi:uncharacterized protein
MQSSIFNVRVPLDGGDDVFLMNTFTDAQVIVGSDVARLLDQLSSNAVPRLSEEEREAVGTLAEMGFIVESHDADRRNLERFFADVRADTSDLRVTVLTTLQCNFACDYCIQGDHDDFNKHAAKMSLETAARVVTWIDKQIDRVRPRKFGLTFFGGEPLLNLPVMYYLAERLWKLCRAKGVEPRMGIITNGLHLTTDIVDRLLPFGLVSVKVTLDGDRDTHNRMRPLRGGQPTFDRIVNNVRAVADRCQVSIGGNFDESSVDSYPDLLAFLREQDFADKLARVAFKPIIRATARQPKGFIPLTPVSGGGAPLGGACMTSAGAACDSSWVLDGHMSRLREETKRYGFATMDGVHMGPCEIHKNNAHTIGPDGALYACPGFATNTHASTGHINGQHDVARSRAAERFERLAAWKECQDCAFIPVCAGGCSVASDVELGDMNKPNCHKVSFEAGVVSLAREAASSR